MNTLRNVHHKSLAWEHNQLTEWERARFIAYSTYKSVFSFNGKQVFKKIKSPADLFPLSSDPKPETLEGKEAEDFMKQNIV